MRAEHAAVDVRLVDDDDGEVREHVRPRVVVREDPDVEHVGVREDEVRAPADGGALLARRVAVVDRGAHLLAQPERGDRAGLVLRERLRGVEVDRARLRVAAEHVERRQVEAQRLAGRRAGGDDRRAVPRALQRLGLVGVQLLDPGGCQCVAQRGVQLVGHRDERRLARALVRLAHEAPVVPAGLQQVGPRLRVSGCGGHPAIVGCRPCDASTRISTARCSDGARRSCTTATACRRCSASARSRRACAPASRSS